jgi:hypothetical protein
VGLQGMTASGVQGMTVSGVQGMTEWGTGNDCEWGTGNDTVVICAKILSRYFLESLRKTMKITSQGRLLRTEF